jgi:hypothetical protein
MRSLTFLLFRALKRSIGKTDVTAAVVPLTTMRFLAPLLNHLDGGALPSSPAIHYGSLVDDGVSVTASDDLGARIVAAIGEPAARELLDVLTRPGADRAALISRLKLRDDAAWLAEMLIDIESDPDDITRLQIVGGLRAVIG